MILFVVRMAIKSTMYGPPKFPDSMSAESIYDAYQSNFEAAADEYGGEKVTIGGIIVDIVDKENGFTIILGNYGNSRQKTHMIECFPWKMRRYQKNRFDVGMMAEVVGRIRENQDSEIIKIDGCQIFGI
jgi:hypothetical protein